MGGRGRAQFGVLELLFAQADGLGEANRQLVVSGAAGIQTAGFLFDHAPELLRDLRVAAGEIAHHGDARHGGAKLVILNRPGADLIQGRGAVAHGFEKGVFDANLGESLDVLL